VQNALFAGRATQAGARRLRGVFWVVVKHRVCLFKIQAADFGGRGPDELLRGALTARLAHSQRAHVNGADDGVGVIEADLAVRRPAELFVHGGALPRHPRLSFGRRLSGVVGRKAVRHDDDREQLEAHLAGKVVTIAGQQLPRPRDVATRLEFYHAVKLGPAGEISHCLLL